VLHHFPDLLRGAADSNGATAGLRQWRVGTHEGHPPQRVQEGGTTPRKHKQNAILIIVFT